jgi:hypothetical protein
MESLIFGKRGITDALAVDIQVAKVNAILSAIPDRNA